MEGVGKQRKLVAKVSREACLTTALLSRRPNWLYSTWMPFVQLQRRVGYLPFHSSHVLSPTKRGLCAADQTDETNLGGGGRTEITPKGCYQTPEGARSIARSWRSARSGRWARAAAFGSSIYGGRIHTHDPKTTDVCRNVEGSFAPEVGRRDLLCGTLKPTSPAITLEIAAAPT